MELTAFITSSQEELEKVAYQTSTLNYHRYFIIVGFEVNRNYRFLRDTDSFLEIQSLDKSNIEVLKRLSLVYSPPDYENIALYISNNIISLPELQNLFHELMNGKHTKTDYLVSISRMNFVFENYSPESAPVNPLDLSEIIDNAMMEKPISFDHFKIALKELLPEYTFSLDQSCISMNNDLKNILIENNKNNYVPKMTTYYNEIKEHEKCVMFFDSDPAIQNYSSKIISIEGYVVYFRF
ncbi:MAG: hypothetical protein K9G65_04945 [Rickettsiaceae bacterium]|nr:hypothetical protein [Rickettsiaceae bacterium]